MYSEVINRKRGTEYFFIHLTDENIFSFSTKVLGYIHQNGNFSFKFADFLADLSEQTYSKKKSSTFWEKYNIFSIFFPLQHVPLVHEHTEMKWFRILKIKPCWTFCAIKQETINIFRFRKKFFVQKGCTNWMMYVKITHD